MTNASWALLGLFVAYFVYASTLGTLTDFPQLAQDERPPLPGMTPKKRLVANDMPRDSTIAAVRAYSPQCWQVNAHIIIESQKRDEAVGLNGRGIGMFVYANNYEIVKSESRQLRLFPFCLVRVTPGATSAEDQISTIMGDEAVLEFDRPIEPHQLSGLTPVAGWVRGNVQLSNNQRTTTDKSDDIVLFANELHYHEAKQLIWSKEQIRLVSKEATVTGKDLELELDGKVGTKGVENANVRMIRLLRDIRFSIELSRDTDLLEAAKASPTEPAEGAGPAADGSSEPPVTRPLTVTARGPFIYDLEKQRCVFEKSVQVIRQNPPRDPGAAETYDQLDCDELELVFEKQEKAEKADRETTVTAAKPKPDGDNRLGGQAKLKTAIARGRKVNLFSEDERLKATGNYLYFDAETRAIVLRGDREMIAIKDNNVIRARSLTLEPDDNKSIKHMVAEGPNGLLEALDPDRPEGEVSLRVRWAGTMTFGAVAGSPHKMITLDKDVEIDHEKMALKCERLLVWLRPAAAAAAGGGKAKGRGLGSGTQLEPFRVQAISKVSGHSDALTLNTESLTVQISYPSDLPPGSASRGPAGAGAATAGPASPPISAAVPGAVVRTTPTAGAAEPGGNADGADSADPAKKSDEGPVDVRAGELVVQVHRVDGRFEPVRARADGDVLLTRTPTSQEQEPITVRGRTLEFERQVTGDLIEVVGNGESPAYVHTSEVTIVGRDKIALDQVTNNCQIAGPGFISLLTDNSLTGQKSGAPQLVRIEWRDRMRFDGKEADFEGGVLASQAASRVECQTMFVKLDRLVSFKKAGNRRVKSAPARIVQVNCDQDVKASDAVRDAQGIARVINIRTQELRYDRLIEEDPVATATGPGSVRIVQRRDATNDEATTVPGGETDAPFMLTSVDFAGQMNLNQAHQRAKFFERVKIVHTPLQWVEEPVNQDQLPAAGMTIEASQLAEMQLREGLAGEKYRDFKVDGNVKVHSRDYWAQCDKLSYDGQKDLLILMAEQNRRASFYRQKRAGEKPEISEASEIRFWRKENRISTTGNDGFQTFEVGSKEAAGVPRLDRERPGANAPAPK